MANYSLVINSRFRPFEYQELLAPALMATQAHQAVEEAYADLSTKASIWDKMANEATDPKAHAMYKKYADDLQSYSDQLAQYGLTPTSRQAMLNMRSRYAKDIVPIETAYKRREADIAAQKEIMLKDPTHLFNRRASEVSLDEYLDNQNLDVLSDNYSRELLTQQVSQAAANLKQTLMKKGALTALGLPYQYERMIQYGASADDVLAAMSKDPKAMPILTKLVEDVMAASGIRNWSSMNGDWASNPTYQAAEAAAMRGLYSAIGISKIDHFTDSFNMQDQLNARQHARAVAEQRRRERVAAEQQRQQQLNRNRIAINPLNIYSQRLLDKDEQNYRKMMGKYSKYFYKSNGKWLLNKAGWDEYNRNTRESQRNGVLGVSGKTISRQVKGQNPDHTEFRIFLDGLGMRGMSSTAIGPWQRERAGSLWGAYVANTPSSRTAKYDATRVTEYDYTIAGAQQGDMKDAIMTAGRMLGGLREVDYDPTTKTFKPTGKKLSMKDLKSDKYKVTATRFSPYGNTVMIQDDEGNVRRFQMPRGINTTNETNRDIMMSWASVLQANREGGTISIPDSYADLTGIPRGTTITVTPEQIQDEYNNAIQQAYLYHSQIGVQNKVKEQEFNPHGY